MSGELEHQLSEAFYFYQDSINIPRYWDPHSRHPRIIIMNFKVYKVCLHTQSGCYSPGTDAVVVRGTDFSCNCSFSIYFQFILNLF